MMVPENEDRHRTAYTVTVDYKHGTTTGISAHDRALTVRALASPSTTAQAFSRPGHMVPLRARPGGVLTRRGHTESALDLCEIAGLPRAGVLCELVEDDEEGVVDIEERGKQTACLTSSGGCIPFARSVADLCCTIICQKHISNQ